MLPPARPVVVVAVRLPGRGEDHAAATGETYPYCYGQVRLLLTLRSTCPGAFSYHAPCGVACVLTDPARWLLHSSGAPFGMLRYVSTGIFTDSVAVATAEFCLFANPQGVRATTGSQVAPLLESPGWFGYPRCCAAYAVRANESRDVNVLTMNQVMTRLTKHGHVIFVLVPKVGVNQVMNTQIVSVLAGGALIIRAFQNQLANNLPVFRMKILLIRNITLALAPIMEALAPQVSLDGFG